MLWPAAQLRVATFNIMAAARGVDTVADAIRGLDVDVVGLQEVDVGTRRAQGVDVPQALAERLGMQAVFGKAMDFDGGAYGVALLARTPLVEVSRHALPSSPGCEPRLLLTARTVVAGTSFLVAVTHLSAAQECALATTLHRSQAISIAEVLGGRDTTVLLGDLNTEAAGPGLAPLAFIGPFAALGLGPSFPAGAPRLRLDHVVASNDLLVDAARLVATGASDHLALVVTLQASARTHD